MMSAQRPIIIQGGMGAGVSSWTLANAVSRTGQLGVVSGTALDILLARRLQVGDPGGHMRRALSHFPIPGVAQRIIDKYFIEGGKPKDAPFKPKPVPSLKPSKSLEELLVASNFVEVYLAKEGHDGPVGINYLEKIQAPNLPSIFGAMLAGVSYVLMGAGIPKAIPGILDRLSRKEPVELKIDVVGAEAGDDFCTRFDPVAFCDGDVPDLIRPDFLAIVSSATLASMLARKSSGMVNGFIIEGPTAGGHNAPPRGKMQLSIEGEPIYGDRDDCDLSAISKLGLPFWLAGSYAEPERISEALEMGAAGVQIGTAFAFCDESGFDDQLRQASLDLSRRGEAEVFTDPVASPTGFPFKVLQMDSTLSDEDVYLDRARICDLGYLRHAYKKENGKVGWRCPSEPIDDYLKKGGELSDTVGRKCVCNGLMSNIGLGQIQRNGELEKPLITSGDDVSDVARFLKPGATSYSAMDVIEYLLPEPMPMIVQPDVAASKPAV
ncbi:MAG: nitronate monooxygenase [Phycisphaerales bacterium]|nr:nitronate monooxygenase [Phycisphaerales bacterium]